MQSDIESIENLLSPICKNQIDPSGVRAVPFLFSAVTPPFNINIPSTTYHDNDEEEQPLHEEGKKSFKGGKIPSLPQVNTPESFSALNSALTSKFVKFPTNPIAPTTMFSLHSHLEFEIAKLVKLFETQQKELLKNFNQQASLIVASVAHNYSSEADIPQTPHGAAKYYNKLFSKIEEFKSVTGVIAIPP